MKVKRQEGEYVCINVQTGELILRKFLFSVKPGFDWFSMKDQTFYEILSLL